MALNATTLKGLIKTNIQATWPSAQDAAWLDAFCLAIAQAVVTHITTSATVAGTATGVTAGAASVPVTGTVS